MLQNKIFYNYLIEIFKTFLLILFGLSLIALTIRAVNFLDLIVENGYPTSIYFSYSFLNLFGLFANFSKRLQYTVGRNYVATAKSYEFNVAVSYCMTMACAFLSSAVTPCLTAVPP